MSLHYLVELESSSDTCYPKETPEFIPPTLVETCKNGLVFGPPCILCFISSNLTTETFRETLTLGSGAGTNLKVGGTGPARSAGKFFFYSAPSVAESYWFCHSSLIG